MELGIAYCQKYLQNGEKLLVGLHTDTRAAFGGRLNPMVRVPLDCVVDDEEMLRLLAEHESGVEAATNDQVVFNVARYRHRKERCDGRAITGGGDPDVLDPEQRENLDTAERLIRSAASSRAGLIALPELWNCHGLETSTRRTPSQCQGRRRSSSAASRARGLPDRGFDPGRRSPIHETA